MFKWTTSESIAALMRNSWHPISRMRITLLERLQAEEDLEVEGALGKRPWRDISNELLDLIIGYFKNGDHKGYRVYGVHMR